MSIPVFLKSAVIPKPEKTLDAPFKMRACMSCKQRFLSMGAHHRMCRVCRSNTDSGIPVHNLAL